MAADERQRRRGHQELAAPREPQCAVALDETPFLFRQRNALAESLHGAPRQPHQSHDRVVAVQDLHRCARKYSSFGGRVVGETRVAIHVVRRDVQHGGRNGFQTRRGLELIARQLEDEDIGPAFARLVGGESIEHRLANIARHDSAKARCAHQRSGERSDRRLAVGAGDREHLLRWRQRACEQLDIANQLDPRINGLADGGLIFRNAGADRDEVRAVERRRRKRTGFDRDIG